MCLPKTPAPPPPPKIPDPPQAASEVNPSVLAAKRRAGSQAAAQAGFQSTIITGGRGVSEFASTTSPSLLGTRAQSEARPTSQAGGSSVAGSPGSPGPNLTDLGVTADPLGAPFDLEALRRRFGVLPVAGRPRGTGSIAGGGLGVSSGGGGLSIVSGGAGGGGGPLGGGSRAGFRRR